MTGRAWGIGKSNGFNNAGMGRCVEQISRADVFVPELRFSE